MENIGQGIDHGLSWPLMIVTLVVSRLLQSLPPSTGHNVQLTFF